MSFIAGIFEQLARTPEKAIVNEVHGDQLVVCSSRALLARIAGVRGWLRARGVQPGDRVAFVAANSIAWVAFDLAVLAEGAVAVPFYVRQEGPELAGLIADCGARVVVAGTPALAEALRAAGVADCSLLDDAQAEPVDAPVFGVAPADPVTLVYTSGTSGDAKGAVLTRGNVDFMLPTTAGALDEMMAAARRERKEEADDRVFHYLPCCFLGSRVVLWTCLSRNNPIHFSTDLDDLRRELATVRPHYFLNVPLLLERMRARVDASVRARGGAVAALWGGAMRAIGGSERKRDRLALVVARNALFPRIRAQLGADLVCLICGSAALHPVTQRWFAELGLPVYQVYGLTETTAIVTMDRPPTAIPGTVGLAIPGVELRLGPGDEILCRGPNVFAGYWNRPEASAQAFTADGWFRTGDQGALADGRLSIVGRVKNVLVPASGHNVTPEPIEDALRAALPRAEHVVLVGHGRPFLAALVAGDVAQAEVDAALTAVNEPLPHYRKVRKAVVVREPFTAENGLLTANQKLKRREIDKRFGALIEEMYA